jgi:ribose/xylose/arabinose/galactoside ABC-type transport system permease subunit
VSNPSDETRPESVPRGGVPPSWSPTPPQPPGQQPHGQQPYGQQGQPFGPGAQQGMPPGMPGSQGGQQAVAPALPASHLGGLYAAPATSPRPAAPASLDRLAVHLIWEAILVGITVVLVIAALAGTSRMGFADILRPVAYLGLVASGLAFSLRTGTPNLAVGSIAAFTAVLGGHLATSDGWSLLGAMTLAVVIAGVIGLATGFVVAALSVPAWAATLAAAILVQSGALGLSHTGIVPLHVTTYPTSQWLAIFVIVSVGGGALWLIPGVRTRLSGARNAAEPGRWTGMSAGLGAVVGLTGSSLLAGVGGAVMAIFFEEADPLSGGFNLTVAALAAVLVGGVSVFGRRAGVTGTLFGAVIVSTLQLLVEVHGFSPAWEEVPAGALIVLGLGVSRALESITNALNRPRAPWGAAAPPGIVPPGYAAPGSVPPPGSVPEQ